MKLLNGCNKGAEADELIQPCFSSYNSSYQYGHKWKLRVTRYEFRK